MCDCCMQEYAEACLKEFKEAITAAYEEEADALLDDDLKGKARSDSRKSIVKKKTGNLFDHVRLIKNPQYSFVQWSEEYQKSDKEAEVWDSV